MKQPSILIDCLLTTQFLSKGTKLSTRNLFLNLLKNSIEFLLDIQVDQNPQESGDIDVPRGSEMGDLGSSNQQ